MVRYRLMYNILYAAISDALDHLSYTPADRDAVRILLSALHETEDMYIRSNEASRDR